MFWVPLPRYVFFIDIFSTLLILRLGLPAFKPGEKIELDFGMDDI